MRKKWSQVVDVVLVVVVSVLLGSLAGLCVEQGRVVLLLHEVNQESLRSRPNCLTGAWAWR